MHRAIVSLMEELEAVDGTSSAWTPRTTPSFRDPAPQPRREKEHAAMMLEWIASRSAFDAKLREYPLHRGIHRRREAAIEQSAGSNAHRAGRPLERPGLAPGRTLMDTLRRDAAPCQSGCEGDRRSRESGREARPPRGRVRRSRSARMGPARRLAPRHEVPCQTREGKATVCRPSGPPRGGPRGFQPAVDGHRAVRTGAPRPTRRPRRRRRARSRSPKIASRCTGSRWAAGS